MLVSGEHRPPACSSRQLAANPWLTQWAWKACIRQAAECYTPAACAPQKQNAPGSDSTPFLHTDPAQITFGGSPNGCFCICENIRLPPAAINLLE